jgi:cysteine desulfuration protein SufE
MSSIPPRLEQIVDLMKASPKQIRVEAMLDYANRIPPLPEGMDSSELERVPECQSPFFVATEIDDEDRVHLFFDAPREAPTVRGFAGILLHGLDGETAEVILDVPDDFYYDMGLEEVVTPLRLRGMGAILARIKRQVADLKAA